MVFSWFPLGLDKWESIFQSGKNQGILLRLEKSGHFTQNTRKIRKNRRKIEKNTGKVREICKPVIVKTMQIWYLTLNKKNNFKKFWKTTKNTGKVREICQSLKKWKP